MPKRDKKDFKMPDWGKISERNLAGQGWTAEDFGITSSSGDAGGLPPVSATGAVPQGVDTRFVSQQDKVAIRKVFDDKNQFKATEGPVEASKNFFGRLFDTSDTWTPEGFRYEGNPVETVWDSAWAGYGWAMDRINQVAAMNQSLLPGGPETFTWEEAGNVSAAQAAVTANAQAANQIGESFGGGVAGQLVSSAALAAGALLNPLGGLARLGDQYAQEGFDINNPEERKQAFEESISGKVATGITDALFTTVVDPTIFVGAGGKLARLKYLDDTFQGNQGLQRLKQQFIDSAAKPIEQKAPIAQFAARTAEVDPVTGKKVLSHREIATRLKGATGQEILTSALYHNTDPETANLIMRAAFNDVEAYKALIDKRPAIGLAMARKQRDRMAKILARDPEKKEALAQIALNAEKKIDTVLQTTPKNSPEYARLLAGKERAQETYAAIRDDKLHVFDSMDNATPEVMGLLRREYDDLVKHDQSLSKFLDDEGMRISTSSNVFAGSTRGFSADNPFGRAVEKSRIRRSKKASQAESVRGRLLGTGELKELENGLKVEKMQGRVASFWKSDVFNNNGFTNAVRVWRWFGEENPQGLIITKGEGAMGSWKAVKAALDDVDIYSGEARTVTIREEILDEAGNTKTITRQIAVGGLERKEKLLGMYMDAVHDSTRGAEATQVALARIEDAMFNDIAAWHGITKRTAESLKNKAMTKKQAVLDGLRNKDVGFWIDENGTKNKAPWLESQIQNGTYMLNYRAFNRLARLYDEQGIIKTLDTGTQFVGDNAKYVYDLFNEIWRPAVLLRLGYTQRNVAEGLFRATAYTFSLDPIRFALAQGGLGVRNAYVKWAMRPSAKKAIAAARLREAGDSAVQMPPKYLKWLDKQIAAADKNIIEQSIKITEPGRFIDDTSEEARDFMISHYESLRSVVAEQRTKTVEAGGSPQELKQLDDAIQDADDNINRLRAITTFTGETEDSIRTLTGLQLFRSMFDDAVQRRFDLDNDLSAAVSYSIKSRAKNRVMNGVLIAPDGTVLREAFNKDSNYTDIALSNLSADATTRSMSIAASDTMQSAIKAYRMKNYVEVKYGDENYFDGVASALRQVKASEIGRMAIDGKTADEIADFLFKTKDGREIMYFIIHGENRLIKQKKKFTDDEIMGMTPESAQQIAENVINRYMYLAPDPDLRNYMRTAPVNMAMDGNAVKPFLMKKDADGNMLYDLQPVIGHIAEEFGVKGIRGAINQITGTGMKWLGTFPEDAFVRAPFYGKRYEDTLRQMIDNLQQQIGPNGKISIAEYETMMRSAHRRALKDTKEWMFTIERRTNLGTYGEVAVPFISAMQNSVTTVGRLLWKDPVVGVLMAKIWDAPERMGIKDDEGNLVFPIPHALIPDGIEKRLGIENLRSFKVGLNQLNLIAPQLGVPPSEGALQMPPLFQFGPIVAIGQTAFMQAGFFDAPDVPTPLKAVFGDNASVVWETWKDYVYGPQGGMNPDILQSLLPATWRRVDQYLRKKDNETYAKLYNANLHSEWLKYQGGLRDTPPNAEEITNMTNNLTLLQFLMNAGSAFPPRYEQTLGVVVDEYRRINDQVQRERDAGIELGPNEADRRFALLYGETLLMSKDLGMTKGYVPANEGMVSMANRYTPLLERVSAELADTGDLSVISMLFSDNANSVFDGSIYAWQRENNIPGVSEMWRERLTPEEAMVQDAKNAGWTKAIQVFEQLDARLAQMGLTSYDYAPQLKAEKDAFIVAMAQDPLYRPWFKDWQDFGSARTTSTVILMQEALNDPTFRADHAQSPVWSAASQYLEGRAQVINALEQSGGEITSMRNLEIKNWWDTFRTGLKTNNPDWGVFANRYLDGDDNPQNPGVSFGMQLVGGE